MSPICSRSSKSAYPSGLGRRSWTIVLGLTLISGCASNAGGMLAKLESHDAEIELTEVPFHSQVTDQCGPAALATVLNEAGIRVGPEELRSRIYIPGRQGSLQLEILATTRHYGRIPYTVDPDISAVMAELQAGRPVLVLQNLGVGIRPVWHYAVVIGYLPDRRQFVLRSGDQKRHLMSARKFIRSWRRATYWGVVALRPGDLPSHAVADRYLRSVAALETIGDTANAVTGYRAATRHWPRNPLAWLGLGNAAYAAGDLHGSRDAYQKLLALNPEDAIALNNLSQVQADLGCRDAALATISSALTSIDVGEPVYRYLRRTLAAIEQTDSQASCL